MYWVVLLMIGMGVGVVLMWRCSPMVALNAEMAERVVTTRATLDEVPQRHPMLPRRRPRDSG